MTSAEIRGTTIGENSSQAIAFFLRELAAQVAELNEHKAARVERARKQPKQMSSAMRRNGKRFYNHFWQTNVTEEMLGLFTPNEGEKWPSELEVNESSLGTCGTNKDTKITRTQ